MLPKMAFTSFASRYREPDIKEGFEDITKVDFIVRSDYLPQSSKFSRADIVEITVSRDGRTENCLEQVLDVIRALHVAGGAS